MNAALGLRQPFVWPLQGINSGYRELLDTLDWRMNYFLVVRLE